MSGEGLAAQKASRSAPPAPATKNKKQRIEAVDLDDDELVRRAVELRSCEASGVTLHTLRTALRQLRSDIPPAPVRDGLNSSLNAVAHSRVELASLLCFGESERAEEALLTELEGAWEFVDKPRPQHDQLQMRVVQWLWLWVRGCGVTNLGRLASLVSAAREEDPIARHAPPNAPGQREKRRKKEELGNQTEIAEEAPGVLAGRPPAQPAAELGPRGGRSQLALLPKAAGGDDDDDDDDDDSGRGGGGGGGGGGSGGLNCGLNCGLNAGTLDADELVRRAVALPSCEASGVTLHALWKALRRVQSEITSPVPVVRGSPNSCSLAELASLLCFGEGGRTEEKLLTELKNAWERVKEPRKKHDQLQMRVVQWLELWLQCGVTDLRRLTDLVRATRAVDPIARDAPPNAPCQREKRPKEEWGEEWGHQKEIAEEARGVLAGRPPAQPAAELGPRGARSQLALLPKAADGDDDDEEAEEMDDAVEEEVEEEEEVVEEVEVEEVKEGLRLHLSGLNKTGYKGVTHMLKMKKFRAMETGPQGKPLGYFDTAVEAAVRYARHIQSQEGSASPTASSAGVLDCAASSMSSSMSGSEPAVESGSPGGQFPLALLPAAGGGDEHDDEVEGASTQTCQICWGTASLVTTKTCNRALPPAPAPAPAPSPYCY